MTRDMTGSGNQTMFFKTFYNRIYLDLFFPLRKKLEIMQFSSKCAYTIYTQRVQVPKHDRVYVIFALNRLGPIIVSVTQEGHDVPVTITLVTMTCCHSYQASKTILATMSADH